MIVVIYALAVALTTLGAPLAADDAELHDAMQEFARAAEEWRDWSRDLPDGDDADVDDLDEEKLWRLSMRLMDDSSENQREAGLFSTLKGWANKAKEWFNTAKDKAKEAVAFVNKHANNLLGEAKCDEESMKAAVNMVRCKAQKLVGLLKKN